MQSRRAKWKCPSHDSSPLRRERKDSYAKPFASFPQLYAEARDQLKRPPKVCLIQTAKS